MQSKQFKFLKFESNNKKKCFSLWQARTHDSTHSRQTPLLAPLQTLIKEIQSGLLLSICTSLTYRDSKGTSINDVPRFLVIFSIPTYLVLLYNLPFLGLSWSLLPILIWDVINERSLSQSFKVVTQLRALLLKIIVDFSFC